MPIIVAPYSPQPYGRAKRMFQTTKVTIKQKAVASLTKCGKQLPIIECLYHKRKLNNLFSSYYLMFGVASRCPKIKEVSHASRIFNAEQILLSTTSRAITLLTVEAQRAYLVTDFFEKAQCIHSWGWSYFARTKLARNAHRLAQVIGAICREIEQRCTVFDARQKWKKSREKVHSPAPKAILWALLSFLRAYASASRKKLWKMSIEVGETAYTV